MTDFDNLVVGFKDNMAKTALFVNGNDQTDVITAGGPVPSLAKLIRTSDERLAALLPDLANRLTLGGDGQYSAEQKAWGRKNLDLDRVDNTADVDKPLSTEQQRAIQFALQTAQSKEDPNNRNVIGGYFAYDGSKLPMRNGADTFFGYLYNNITARRDWLLPDASGTIALKSDITGVNSGTNTGDETTATIKGKLGITTLSGVNTGDETNATILQKLNLSKISGVNTGDETHDTIIQKIGFEVMPLGARNAINGVAPLDANRLIPVENLPPAFESIAVVDNYGVMPTPGVDKRLYVTVAETGLYYWHGGVYVQLNTVMNNTDQLGEGDVNLYFTQLRAIQAVLSTYTDGANTAVVNTDTTVGAIGKLQTQLNVAVQDYISRIQSEASTRQTGLDTKEDLAHKVTDFSLVDDIRYPTVKAVKTVTDQVAANATAGLNEEISNRTKAVNDLTNSTNLALGTKELLANKAIDLAAPDNTHYPTTLAVKSANDQVAANAQAALDSAVNTTNQSLATKENLANKATDFSVANNTLYPTVLAAKTYADSLVVGLVRDCGNWDASGNAFPTTGGSGASGAILKGNLWYVSVAGTLGGKAVNIGDSFRALVDNPGQTAANWGVLESNIGYVPYNATNPAGYISGITNQMVLTALNIPSISGVNTGDETLATIQSKLGSTSNLPEGTNLYFTNARAVAAPLTGYAVATTNVAVAAGDSVLTAFGKHQKQINDLQTANTGTNTGDETKAGILSKLGATEVTGSNTGDETKTSILSKLGATAVTGSNTGDETLATIQSKLGNTSNLPEGTNLYFSTSRVLNTALTGFAPAATNADVVAGDTVLTAFGKHQKQIDDLQVANTGTNTGDETKASIISKLTYTPANKAGDHITGRLGMNQVGPLGPATLNNGTNSNWNPIALPVSDGKCLFTDEEFAIGNNGVSVYNNTNSGAVVHTRQADASAPNASKQVIKIDYDGSGNTDPGIGGFVQIYNHAVNKIFVQRFRAKIPVGYSVVSAENAIGVNGQSYWLTATAGTGKYEDYIRVSHCGDSGTFSSGGHVYLTGNSGGAMTWYLASCATFEVTTRVANTGDETQSSILSKLGLSQISGVNTGDETTASIKSKLGYGANGNYALPDAVKVLTANTSTTSLDLSVAAAFEVTLAASTTFAFDFSKVPALNNQMFSFVLTIINDGTSGRGVSFPAGTKWAGGQIPARTTTANARDDWYFYSRDGVNWIGSLSNQDVK